jgi:hypothetical protein
MRTKQVRRAVHTSVHLGRAAKRSFGPAWHHREAFRDLEAYCTFVGYPRSGHTLVGSLLDAHPDVLIAHELDALRLIRWRIPRAALNGLLVRRSEEFAAGGCKWMGYDYAVPGWWQGRYRRLRVIGDKRGATTSSRLGERPCLIQRLRSTVRVPLRFVRVVRNPYDNIARMYLVARERGRTLAEVTDNYRRLTHHGDAVRSLVSEHEWTEVRSEDLIDDPVSTLAALCMFLGVAPTPAYLEACAGVVFPTPNRTRDQVEWTPVAIERIQELIDSTPHLTGYRFD